VSAPPGPRLSNNHWEYLTRFLLIMTFLPWLRTDYGGFPRNFPRLSPNPLPPLSPTPGYSAPMKTLPPPISLAVFFGSLSLYSLKNHVFPIEICRLVAQFFHRYPDQRFGSLPGTNYSRFHPLILKDLVPLCELSSLKLGPSPTRQRRF